MAVLCWMNAIQYSPWVGSLYATGVFLCLPDSWTQTVSRSLPNCLQGLLGDRPTDRPTDHATRSFTIGGIYLRIKEKERKCIYIAPFVYYVYLKALRHGSHSFTCKIHNACLSFVSVHQMAPPLTEVGDIQLQLTTHLSTPKGWKAELAWLLTYSGRFTHII